VWVNLERPCGGAGAQTGEQSNVPDRAEALDEELQALVGEALRPCKAACWRLQTKSDNDPLSAWGQTVEYRNTKHMCLTLPVLTLKRLKQNKQAIEGLFMRTILTNRSPLQMLHILRDLSNARITAAVVTNKHRNVRVHRSVKP
jgi:hypothetical protein